MQHTIKAVSKRTGLTPHVIRIWEKRYGAVVPSRNQTNRRFYSDEEVERLLLLREAVNRGHSISSVAQLPSENLQKLVSEAIPTHAQPVDTLQDKAQHLVETATEAVRHLDSLELEKILTEAALELGNQGLLQRFVGPLAYHLGELWRTGSITAAHEHFATAAIRVFLGRASRSFAADQNAPGLIVATPSGQLHELGAVMVAAAATNVGWRVTYLGTGLPPAEIAGAALQNGAKAVALSIVYPDDDPNLAAELQSLRKYLPHEVKILVGGRAAEGYKEVLNQIGAIRTKDINDFAEQLDLLRGSLNARKS
jgi:MerR family transcriptional regulator, light-induced transcriptional regulator